MLAAAIAACHGAAVTEPKPQSLPARLTVLTQPGPDTAYAIASQSLFVQVTDSDGAPVASVPVEFAVFPTLTGQVPAATLGASLQPATVVTTDEDGKAAARVRYGPRAGSVTLRVTVPLTDLTADVTATILPGAPFRFEPLESGLRLHPQSTRTVPIRLIDQNGNVRTELPELVSRDPSLFTLRDSTIQAQSRYGAAQLVLRAGAVVDSMLVSIVPSGLVVTEADRLEELDGTGSRVVTVPPIQLIEVTATSAGHELIAVLSAFGDRAQLYAINLNGSITPLVNQIDFNRNGYGGLSVTSDGGEVYFVSIDSLQRAAIWRLSRSDGSLTQVVSSATESYSSPSVSPDGHRLAYIASEFNGLVVRDLGTGAKQRLPLVGAQSPRWSPTDDLIAYLNSGTGELSVARSDGTGVRTLVPGGFGGPISWSPDGRWILGRSSGNPVLVEVETAARVQVRTRPLNGWWVWGPSPEAGTAVARSSR